MTRSARAERVVVHPFIGRERGNKRRSRDGLSSQTGSSKIVDPTQHDHEDLGEDAPDD